MNFLIISQKCQFNSNYTLNNLTGHGRFDIICRSILASTRELQSDKGSSIFCYLKGGEEKGWLKIDPSFVEEIDDEISIAAKIKNNWSKIATKGNLINLFGQLPKPITLLSEYGAPPTSFTGTIVLGAQNDLSRNDKITLEIENEISLGSKSLLASHAIIYVRQLNLKM